MLLSVTVICSSLLSGKLWEMLYSQPIKKRVFQGDLSKSARGPTREISLAFRCLMI